MSNKYCWAILLCLGIACKQTAKQAESAQGKSNTDNAGLTFVFSKQASTPVGGTKDDWCHVPLPEAAVINADPINANRRLFTLSDGPHRVAVDFSNIVAAFVLKKSGNTVEIYTSDNYPECLSNRSNFSIGADGTTFHYDNQKHIAFDIQLIPLSNGTQIALEMAPGAGYGIIVRR